MKVDSSTADAVTQLGAGELAEGIKSGQFTASEVVDAHIARIEQVNGRLNAVVIPLFEKARRQAAAADEKQQRGEPLGLLHGVPVTIKECFHVAGTASCIGVGRLKDETFLHDSPLVARLRRAGAIVLGKTNVPQLMLLHETDNPVYGRTNNPWDLDRSSGGSSGGEAAIIAAGGSPLGLASDLGGSIRQPAHSCGVHGFMPTLGRFTIAGKRVNLLGMEAIALQPGPLARRVADLTLALRVLSDTDGEPFDATIAPAPFRWSEQVSLGDLRVGVFTDDGFFPASPSIRRATREAGKALQARGIAVETFTPPSVSEAVRVYLGLFSADGGADYLQTLGASKKDWRIRRLLSMAYFPRFVRRSMTASLRAMGQRRLADLVGWTGAISARAYWKLTAERADFQRRFFEAMDAQRLDAVIFPPHALPAFRHGLTMHLPTAASYCFLANLLAAPCGVVAATRVQDDEESDRPQTGDWVERAARTVEAGSAGLPVGVQVLARPWQDHIALALMGFLETHFRAQPDYPTRPPI